ncbi:MAG: hypothetical protein AM326_04240 [Candidatus Thorarchaeota archaeon SMTZ-45]|nr:MAG: hypothetical protein AM326_04240 [Candidatus Thorarchaeota archaeon SMTZ-45]KXH74508.1 MAG: hypothetical protein AM325_05900 [Candidatus Thorarchaeota archaeon SMTZ1-45]
MRKMLPHFLFLFTITCLILPTISMPVHAAPPVGWSGDDNLGFLLEVNGINAAKSNVTKPIELDVSDPIMINVTILTETNLTIQEAKFQMAYMSVPIINPPPFDMSIYGELPNNTTVSYSLGPISLAPLFSIGNITLVSGTITGLFSFTYSNSTSPSVNTTISQNFVLHIGPTGFGVLYSVTGLVTAGFAVMAVFSLILSLDEFQRGILSARKMRGAVRGSDVGIFPVAVVLRRKPKKEGETIDKDELVRRVSQAASSAWDGKRCPQCGKKWKKDAPTCGKCGIDTGAAVQYFSQDIAEYAPKALRVIRPKSKVTVGQLGKKLKLKPDKAGALAAALVDMGVLQTKTVKVPLKKVAFAGMSLAGTYWSIMQMFYGATPDWVTVLLTTSAGLVVSVFIGYFMNFLARVPSLGYD